MREVSEIDEAHCFLVGEIGRAVDDAAMTEVRVRTKAGALTSAIAGRVEAIAREETSRIHELWRAVLEQTSIDWVSSRNATLTPKPPLPQGERGTTAFLFPSPLVGEGARGRRGKRLGVRVAGGRVVPSDRRLL